MYFRNKVSEGTLLNMLLDPFSRKSCQDHRSQSDFLVIWIILVQALFLKLLFQMTVAFQAALMKAQVKSTKLFRPHVVLSVEFLSC